MSSGYVPTMVLELTNLTMQRNQILDSVPEAPPADFNTLFLDYEAVSARIRDVYLHMDQDDVGCLLRADLKA